MVISRKNNSVQSKKYLSFLRTKKKIENFKERLKLYKIYGFKKFNYQLKYVNHLPYDYKQRFWFFFKIKEQKKIKTLFGNMTKEQLGSLYKRSLPLEGHKMKNFLALLEHRLDFILYRMNFCFNIVTAHIMIKNNMIFVSDKKITKINFFVKKYNLVKIVRNLKKIVDIRFLQNIVSYRLNYYLLASNFVGTLSQADFLIKNGFVMIEDIVCRLKNVIVNQNWFINVTKSIYLHQNFNIKFLYKNLILKKVFFIKLLLKNRIKNNKLYTFNTKSIRNTFFNKIKHFKIFMYFRNIRAKLHFKVSRFLIYPFIRKYKYIFKNTYNNIFIYINNNIFISKYKKNKLKIIKKKTLYITLGQLLLKKLHKFRLKDRYIFINNKKLKNKNIYILNKNLNIKIYKKHKLSSVFVFKDKLKTLLKLKTNKDIYVNKVSHLEVNYKLNLGLFINYFNINSLTYLKLIYFYFLMYYYSQYK